MTNDAHETLSAFVDGEVAGEAEARLLDKVLTDKTLSRRWTSYHLIGDVMRQQSHLRKGANPGSFAAERARVSPKLPAPAVISPVGGLALAASVALVAIVGMYELSPRDGGVARSAAVGGVPVERLTTAVAVEGPHVSEQAMAIPGHRLTTAAESMRRLTRQTWSDAAPGVATRLNGYLVTHNEHLANGLRGMHPYARIVAYDGRGN